MRFWIILAAAAGFALSATAANAADGAAVYKTKCAQCHGATGAADTATGVAMKATVLAGNAKIAGMADADLVKAIKEGKRHAVLKAVSDEDLTAVATYIKGLPTPK